MIKLTLFMILGSLSFSLFGKEICLKGFSSVWSFDQNKKIVVLDEKKSADVCQISQEELNSNFEFKFYKNSTFIYSKKIFWPELTLHDVEEAGQLKAVINKVIDHKVIKFPITLNMVNRYQVINISTGEVWGKGLVK